MTALSIALLVILVITLILSVTNVILGNRKRVFELTFEEPQNNIEKVYIETKSGEPFAMHLLYVGGAVALVEFD